jgi:predicted HNH restriction endonuclease
MKLIKNIDELKNNIKTVEHLIVEGSEEEKRIVYDLIRRGICFVAYKVKKELRFAPSRFIGYVNNNLEKHEKAKGNNLADGKETNHRITKIIKEKNIRTKLGSNDRIDKCYIEYCESIGIVPTQMKRKYWELKMNDDFEDNTPFLSEFPEGNIVEKIHKSRERNSKVIKVAKANFKKKHGHLFCQICKFNFENKYGSLGKDFIEGHHTVAVCRMTPDQKTKPEDIAMLCSNCHRMVHKRRPWLTMGELGKLIK